MAFVTLLACGENIENYLPGDVYLWLGGGTFLAMAWAYEYYCHNQGGDDGP